MLTPASWAREDREWLAEHPPVGTGWALPDPDGDYPPSVVADDLVTHEVVDPGLVPVQAAALRQHVTQVTVAESGDAYALVQRHRRPAPRPRGLRPARPDHRPARDARVGRGASGTRHTELLGGHR